MTRLPGAEPQFLLQDPYRYTARTAVLSGPGFYAATLFDGRRTPTDVALEVEASVGTRGSAREVETLARELDDAFLLDSPRFRAEKDRVDRGWEGAKSRPLFVLGREIPTDRAALSKVLDAFYSKAPEALPRPSSKRLVAAVAPHIDPRAGGRVYAPAYRALAREAADADLFVLLGTGHQPFDGPVALTDKDYDTPFGPVETDREALDVVARSVGAQAMRNSAAHRTEHSLEFTSVFLAHALREARRRPIRALPILVGHFGELGSAAPDDDPTVGALVEALRALRRDREARGQRVVFVAGVDLAHRGTRFGEAAVDAEALPALEALDRAFAAKAASGDAAAVLADYLSDREARRYCGFSSLWVLAKVLGPSEGEVLSYGSDLQAGAVVTFFSGTMRQ